MKIDVSYGRKVPGSQEYSSESLHISVSQELGDEPVDDAEVHSAIEALYQLLKTEVDQRLPAHPQREVARGPTFPGNGQLGYRFANGGPAANGGRVARTATKASPKQVNFLLSLANKGGLSFDQLGQFLQDQTGKRDPYELTSSEASRVIDSLKE